ncbi:hypothetical protein C6A63_20430 [Escherichia coli]|uniref:Uncharacterized protein n=1 Tax=Shigella sonnei TaxID=624 RepID=A0A7Z1D1T7_SHISO|nr:hypothetical protein CA270_05870 [Escherichia coli]EFN8676167.1 hypothetical protein [Escherichia coli O8]EFO3084210.1 hypothetical protein [Escherichia coli O9]EFY0635727.1 hypothetical protein [Shigella flexneri]OYE51591.1 hypothetical protein CI633_13980 [Shigella sonnei]TYF32324.1 hypothetical protein DJ502_27405 [Klebsiella pneumoniae]HAJ7332625.1 hypothetical protein [Escherichia coli UCI 52]
MPHKAFFSLSLYGTSWNRIFDLVNRDVCWGGAICSLKRETRLSARNTEIKNPATFLQSDRVKIIFIF